jgi:hypothetical protein
VLKGENKYTRRSFLMSVIDGGKWSTSRSGHFAPDKETWYPLNNILRGAHSRSARFREDKIFFLLPEFESRTVWPRRQFAIPTTLPGSSLVKDAHFMVLRYTKSPTISVRTAPAEESYRSYPFQIQPSLIRVPHLPQHAYVHMVRH